MKKAYDLDGRRHRIGFREVFEPDIPGFHELLDIGNVVRERNDVGHFAPDAFQNRPDVLKGFARLGPHVPSPDDAAELVERNLSLDLHDVAIALNHPHGERSERPPYGGGIESVNHLGGNLGANASCCTPSALIKYDTPW
jgi:hypothetical protein